MNDKLIRVGTTYIPVSDVDRAADWYTINLEAGVNYQDDEKAILDIATHSLFLVKAKEGQTANFYDYKGEERFSMTFEVDGLEALNSLHDRFVEKGIQVGEIENRGHAGRNFVFTDPDGNKFDVWSELSPVFKEFLK
ncbi:VOC family protein [Bacillus sp. Marseille-Q1617]|uniref:VOC family protein n=1 Tax=Bacillus sp. Marseille-Q1617 TaxID=2736887 RepID=UPI00158B8A93|nr:VOC family protein [Bacillus sp. Marseille-Q1617]